MCANLCVVHAYIKHTQMYRWGNAAEKKKTGFRCNGCCTVWKAGPITSITGGANVCRHSRTHTHYFNQIHVHICATATEVYPDTQRTQRTQRTRTKTYVQNAAPHARSSPFAHLRHYSHGCIRCTSNPSLAPPKPCTNLMPQNLGLQSPYLHTCMFAPAHTRTQMYVLNHINIRTRTHTHSRCAGRGYQSCWHKWEHIYMTIHTHTYTHTLRMRQTNPSLELLTQMGTHLRINLRTHIHLYNTHAHSGCAGRGY